MSETSLFKNKSVVQQLYNQIEEDHHHDEVVSGALGFSRPPPAEWRPDQEREIPIGTFNDVNGYFNTKFERGWLAGHGGNEVETALGTTVLPIRPSGYNSHFLADVAAVNGYASGIPLMTNWDLCDPVKAPWGPDKLFRDEWIPTTYGSKLAGLDPTTGLVRPRVYPALDGITQAPLAQFNQNTQVNMGGGSTFPSIPFGQRLDSMPANPAALKKK